MKKIFKYWLITLTTLLLVACGNDPNITTPDNALNHNPVTTEESQNNKKTSTHTQTEFTPEDFDTDNLKGTNIFVKNGLEHIFFGSINRDGKATGYHYEGLAPDVTIIESTRSKTDRHGVYRAKITIDGEPKKAYSSFFPQKWTPQEVVDAINEAYENSEHISGNIFEGESQGIKIQMYLTDDDKIISAFPIYER